MGVFYEICFLNLERKLSPLNPIVHFWLHHTVHCAKIISACLHAGSALAERVGQGEVGGITRRVTCTWWLLGLAIKENCLLKPFKPFYTARLGCKSTNSCPGCMDRLRKRYSHLVGGSFWQGRLLGL